MTAEQFLKALSQELARLSKSGEEVDINEITEKINAFLEFLRMQEQVAAQLAKVNDLKTKFAFAKYEQPSLIATAAQTEEPKRRGRPKKEAGEPELSQAVIA